MAKSRSVFDGACDKSPDGTHRVVNMHRVPPYLACAHCGLRNRLLRYEVTKLVSEAARVVRDSGAANHAKKSNVAQSHTVQAQGEKEHSDV